MKDIQFIVVFDACRMEGRRDQIAAQHMAPRKAPSPQQNVLSAEEKALLKGKDD